VRAVRLGIGGERFGQLNDVRRDDRDQHLDAGSVDGAEAREHRCIDVEDRDRAVAGD